MMSKIKYHFCDIRDNFLYFSGIVLIDSGYPLREDDRVQYGQWRLSCSSSFF